jgi:hypothetical protein
MPVLLKTGKKGVLIAHHMPVLLKKGKKRRTNSTSHASSIEERKEKAY